MPAAVGRCACTVACDFHSDCEEGVRIDSFGIRLICLAAEPDGSSNDVNWKNINSYPTTSLRPPRAAAAAEMAAAAALRPANVRLTVQMYRTLRVCYLNSGAAILSMSSDVTYTIYLSVRAA